MKKSILGGRDQCVCSSKEPVSEEDEEEKNDHHDHDLCHQRGPEVQIARLFPVLLGAHGQPLGLVTQIWRERERERERERDLRPSAVSFASITQMKSTKVQTLGAYCTSPAYYANARARKLATPLAL